MKGYAGNLVMEEGAISGKYYEKTTKDGTEWEGSSQRALHRGDKVLLRLTGLTGIGARQQSTAYGMQLASQ